MHAFSIAPQTKLAKEIRTLLVRLELQSPGTPEELKKHFRFLIKQHHPDHSNGCLKRATFRSREIITAHRRLQEILNHFPELYTISQQPDSPAWKNQSDNKIKRYRNSDATKNQHNDNRKFQFQLFESNESCYAIPLNAIERITSTGFDVTPSLHSACYRPFYSNGIADHYIAGDKLDWQEFRFIVLLRNYRNILLGLALAQELQPTRIIQLDLKHASIYNPVGGNPGLFFCTDNRHYFCPDDLAFPFLTGGT